MIWCVINPQDAAKIWIWSTRWYGGIEIGGRRRSMKGMPGTVILHPSLSASKLSTDLDCQGPRTYAAPRIGKPLTLARKQSRGEGGCGGGMPTGCPAWVLMRQSAEQQDRLSGTGGVNKLIVARVHFCHISCWLMIPTFTHYLDSKKGNFHQKEGK